MNETPKITLSNAYQRETPDVKVEFVYNSELINELKTRTNARWSANMNCWYIPKDNFIDCIKKEFNDNSLWFKTRFNVEPCNDCVYNIICPPISRYELFFNKYNLCKQR